MMLRTHIACVAFAIILFLPFVNNKIVFAAVALLASFIPDIDAANSAIGRRHGRILRFFVKHRGIVHSYTLAVLFSLCLAYYVPQLAFGFFLGYGIHLLGDSFTIEGIAPFWPWKKRSKGLLTTGSYIETGIFIFLIIFSIFLIVNYLLIVF